jgi:phosphate transport system protein
MFNFKELIELWRTDNLLTQALNDSNMMLESTHEMFVESVRSLRESDKGEMKINVYDKDQQVNRYEREVRRKVLKHLAITGGVNIIPGLILTSIVIDIERIGDYTKNIMDLAVTHPKRLDCGGYDDVIAKIEDDVERLFEAVIPAVKNTDKPAAQRLIKENWWIIKKCDEIVNGLIKGTDPALGPTEAVSTAMYARYLKRIAAHLMNVASSVVNPFEGIGFHREED